MTTPDLAEHTVTPDDVSREALTRIDRRSDAVRTILDQLTRLPYEDQRAVLRCVAQLMRTDD